MMSVRTLAIVASTVFGFGVLATPQAQALTSAELKCQQAIGKEGTRYAKKRHRALRTCEDAQVTGQTCDTGKRDQQITMAEGRLAQQLAGRCTGVVLENLGFPGTCPDPSGPPFTAQDLTACIRDTHAARVDMAIATEYPTLPGGPTSAEEQCQKRIGIAGERFIASKMKHRSKCLNDQLKGKLGPSVNCRAQVPPNGSGTGDSRTDSRIQKAITKLRSQIASKCSGIVLENLGFPGMCSDPDGPPFSTANLQDCIEDGHEQKADEMVNIEYPGGVVTTPTPTPTATAGVPTTTATTTPGGATATRTATPTGGTPAPTPTSCVLPNPIPEVLSLTAKTGIDLDTGWTGIAHDLPGVDNASIATLRLSNCNTSVSSPTCGQCDTDGPIVFTGPSKNCRCFNLGNRDASTLTACDPEMPSTCGTPGETCECFFGPPLPLSSGAVPVCVINRYTAPITGTANIADAGPNAGSGASTVRIESSVHNGLSVDQPCPTCENDPTPRDGITGGTCNGGPRNTQPCDVGGTNPFFGGLSYDCPPARAANIGNLDIRFNNVTTGQTQLGTGPACTAFGAAGTCFCDTCNNASGQACNADAECPDNPPGTPGICGGPRCVGGTFDGAACDELGGNTDPACGQVGSGACSLGTCGGSTCATGPRTGEPCGSDSECNECTVGPLTGGSCTIDDECGGNCGRAGEATRLNACSNGVCVADPAPGNPNDGRCQSGPNDGLCSIEKFRGCTGNVDCNPPPSGNCGNCQSGQQCTLDRRDCFRNPIVRQGMAGTQMAVLAATFCIPPTSSSSLNAVAGLPGPGALIQPTNLFRSGEDCGNGVLDPDEQCDFPVDGACSGECRIDCRCPGTGCGNDMVEPPEDCDGADDAACPGACQANCSCGTFCGDDTVNGSEECDGTDDTACPGVCLPTCACPICGDNDVNQPGEACDGSDDSACPGACQPNCTCGGFCGNNMIDGTEECDGTALGSCAGTCQPDCMCAAFCGNGEREAGENCDPGNPPGIPADEALCPGDCQSACTCPAIGTLSFVVTPVADLDTGWTGTSHDFGVQAGTRIDGEIAACDTLSDPECTFFANVGSFCSGDASLSCTETSQCPLGQACVINTYGPPLPLASGGVPVCIVNRFSGDVTGTYNLLTGDTASRVPLNSLVHLATDVSQPCPICDCGEPDPHDCTVGESGTCSDLGGACTVEGVGPLGPTSNDCPPNPATNVSGGGLTIVFDPSTSGSSIFPSNQACDGSGFTAFNCWCDGQTQPNACVAACDGGTRDGLTCTTDANCPGAPGPAPVCKPLCRQEANAPVGEGRCVAGPIDRRCAQAGEVSCTTDAECLTLGPCQTDVRRCFLDPIVREGAPGTATNILAATFCIAATSSPAVNNTAGLPGPGSIRAPNDVIVRFCGDNTVNQPSEECDGTADANCPGACAANCECTTSCGNGMTEFGEQCDPGMPPGTLPDDAACPSACAAAGSATECTCPAICGDGFVGPGEQCDPGGIPPATPPSDAACPGQCTPGVPPAGCQCPLAVCGNGMIEVGELCEFPNVNCGPLQLCQIAPPPGCLVCIP